VTADYCDVKCRFFKGKHLHRGRVSKKTALALQKISVVYVDCVNFKDVFVRFI